MHIQKAIQEFLEVRELDNCTPKTLRTYEQRLRYFSTWLRSAHRVEDVEHLRLEHLRGWMAYLKKTPTYTSEDVQRLLDACEEGILTSLICVGL